MGECEYDSFETIQSFMLKLDRRNQHWTAMIQLVLVYHHEMNTKMTTMTTLESEAKRFLEIIET